MDLTTNSSSRPALRIAAAVLAASLTAIGIFVLGRASSSVHEHGLLLAGASIGAIAGLWFGLRHSPDLRTWSIGGIVVTLGVALALGGLLSRPQEVNEQVVTADVTAPKDAMAPTDAMAAKDAPARNELVARGTLEPLAHAGRGTASIIRTTDGRHVLTLTDFETDAGPDLVVWLVKGNPGSDSDVEAGERVSLGKLKGTSGDQQYVLPADVDPAEFTHAYVWCRAFSVGFTRARLA